MRFTAHSEVVVAVVVGFIEDRMMDIITGRAPPSVGMVLGLQRCVPVFQVFPSPRLPVSPVSPVYDEGRAGSMGVNEVVAVTGRS